MPEMKEGNDVMQTSVAELWLMERPMESISGQVDVGESGYRNTKGILENLLSKESNTSMSFDMTNIGFEAEMSAATADHKSEETSTFAESVESTVNSRRGLCYSFDSNPTNSPEIPLSDLSSPIVLSPSLPPVGLVQRFRSTGNRATGNKAIIVESNTGETPWNRDHVIHINKEDDAQFSAAVPGTPTSEAEMPLSYISLPDPETIGGHCRNDSICDDQFRLVSKCGQRHIYSKVSVTMRCLKYTCDIFTTLVDLEWKFHLVVWMASFCLSWVGFGVLWWFTVIPEDVTVGTNVTDHRANASNSGELLASESSCLARVQDFAGAVLFSIETQMTIGYGSRYIKHDCHPLGFILLFIQILVGVCIAFFLSGVIFRKLSRPYGRATTILFSKYAVIRLDDSGSSYCLEFRMGDIRKSHVIGTSIRALLVKDRLTKEGERIPLCQYPLQLDTQSSVTDSFVFMPWPIIMRHTVDSDSPLWIMSKRDLRLERFEIIIMFEGVVESTGASTQFRTSYLPSEVLWGHRFVVLPVLDSVDCDGETSRLVDFVDFDKTIPVAMPEQSAKEFKYHRDRLAELSKHKDDHCPENLIISDQGSREIGSEDQTSASLSQRKVALSRCYSAKSQPRKKALLINHCRGNEVILNQDPFARQRSHSF